MDIVGKAKFSWRLLAAVVLALAGVTVIVLVARDGEWTRRPVRSVQWAHRFANQQGIPSYDAAVVGYPERMREYNRRQKLAGKHAAAEGAAEAGRPPE